MNIAWAITSRDCGAPLGAVKPLRFAPTPSGLTGLTATTAGTYVMARQSAHAIRRTHGRELHRTERRENNHASTVDHANHHGDDRPAHAPVLRLRHDGATGARFAKHHHAGR